MLVALAIVAVAAAVAYPRLGGTPPRVSLQSFSLQLASQLRACRAEALRRNMDVAVTIDVAQQSFTSDIQLRPSLTAKGIVISLKGTGIEWLDEKIGRITFKPDGSAGDAKVFLRDKTLLSVISVDWLTGAIHTESKG